MRVDTPASLLHRLPNGQWVRLNNIAKITPREATAERGPIVDICEVHQSWTALPFESFCAAQAYADELAGMVNAASKQVA